MDLLFEKLNLRSVTETLLQSRLQTKLGVLLLTVLFIRLWKRRRVYAFAWKIPGPMALPIIGNCHQLFFGNWFMKTQDFYAYYKKQGGPAFRMWLGSDVYLILYDLKKSSVVMNQALRKGASVEVMQDLLQRSILSTKNIPQWRSSRKSITPTFSFAPLKSYIQNFHSESLILVKKWQHQAESGTSFNPEHDLNLATFDMVMMSTLGINPQAQNKPGEPTFCSNADLIMNEYFNKLLKPYLQVSWIARLTGQKEVEERLTKSLQEEVKAMLNHLRERKKRMKANQLTPEDIEELKNPSLSFAELMMESPDYQGNAFTEEELIEQILIIIAAGQDTTKSQNIVTLIMLALNQDIQDKLIEELDSVLGKDPSYCPTYEDLANLHYLEMIIKESLRVCPAAPVVSRLVVEDLDLGDGFILPSGVNVALHISGLHHDPEYYPNPERFDPNRWTPEAVASRPPNTFIPFSMGPRNCIGAKYAMMAMKTVISTILREYRILPSKECPRKEDFGFNWQITIKVKPNSMIRLQKRH